LELVINGRFLSQRATGVQRVAQEFTRALDRLLDEGTFPGLHVRLVAQAGADPASLELRHIAFEEADGGRGHLWEQFVLPRHVGKATLLCLGNTAPIASLIGGRAGVMLHDQAHLLFPDDYSRTYRLLHRVIEGVILRRARPLILVSNAEREALEQRNPRLGSPIVVAPNGSWIDDAAAGELPQRSKPGGYGLFVGSLTHRKNIGAVLSTAIRLARERHHHFRFVGPPADPAWLANAVPEDVRSYIHFTGYASNAELPALYRDAAYLLYPSFYEASGLPPSEAMSFGCPTVVSDLPVMRERCGPAALYCDPRDPGSIHAAVCTVLDDPDRANALVRAGLDRVRHFTWRQQARIIVDALADPVRALHPRICRDGDTPPSPMLR
jgi:glycosyltransferase involved in cell wall biosynthesis